MVDELLERQVLMHPGEWLHIGLDFGSRPMQGNLGQSWILDSMLWIRDAGYWIPDSKKRWIPFFFRF